MNTKRKRIFKPSSVVIPGLRYIISKLREREYSALAIACLVIIIRYIASGSEGEAVS